MSGYGVLARVLTGWTGDVTYEGSLADVTITPQVRESAASFIARLTHAARALDGALVTWSADSSGTLTVTSTGSFNLVFSGNCGTRTGFTGTYSGASTFTADDPIPGVWIPQRGMRLGAPLLAVTATRGAVADGSAAPSPHRMSAGGKLVAWDDDVGVFDTGYECDYWHDGRLFGRVIVDGARYVPLGITRTTNAITLELDVREVA